MADTVRVLVVDEDPNVLDLTAESLETEAPELYCRTQVMPPFDVCFGAFFDVSSPTGGTLVHELVSDSIEVATAASATAVHERDPDLPCVLYTARDRETVVAEYDTTLSGVVRKRTGTDRISRRRRSARARPRPRRGRSPRSGGARRRTRTPIARPKDRGRSRVRAG